MLAPDDQQLFLVCDFKDDLELYGHAEGKDGNADYQPNRGFLDAKEQVAGLHRLDVRAKRRRGSREPNAKVLQSAICAARL